MRIMSLNVNRFSGLERWNSTDTFENLDQCPKAREIIRAIEDRLGSDAENIAVLQEVPYMDSPIRNGVTCSLYDQFAAELSARGYEILPPEGKGLTCTLAVVRWDSGWSSASCAFVQDYRNKYVLAERNGLLVLGVHAPAEPGNAPGDVKAFFDGLAEYARKNRDKRLVILGDMNVHSEKPCSYYTVFHSIRTETQKGGLGYSDKVRDGVSTHLTGHTIDHVLLSPALERECTVAAEVIPQEELPLSDHAVIVVDVQRKAP